MKLLNLSTDPLTKSEIALIIWITSTIPMITAIIMSFIDKSHILTQLGASFMAIWIFLMLIYLILKTVDKLDKLDKDTS